MRGFVRFRKNESGATLVEATLVFAMMMILTFGLIEFGIVLFQYNSAETATSVGARFVATRGPIVTGMWTVLTGGQPQARITDIAVCGAGGPDMIIKASSTVFVGGLPAARIGDMTVHGGVIVTGLPTVLIGG